MDVSQRVPPSYSPHPTRRRSRQAHRPLQPRPTHDSGHGLTDAARLSLIEQSVDVLATFDAIGACRSLSARGREILGLDVDQFDLTCLRPPDGVDLCASVVPTLLASGSWAGELMVAGPRGTIHLDARLATDGPGGGELRGWTLVAHDITAMKALHAELVHRATHDPLTGIPNRAHFVQCLDDRIAAAPPVAVVYMDLDGFKAVNDSLGHDIGDGALIEIARRLDGLVTAGGGVAARLGGDEFVVIPPAVWTDPISELHRGIFATPIVVDGNELSLDARFGVATSVGAETARHLMVRADQAMYRAKRATKRR